MKAVNVQCEHCRGTGRRELTTVESDTLQAVGSTWSTTDQIALRLWDIQGYTIKGPALCNRLVDLHRIGLVQRRAASGKHNEWKCFEDTLPRRRRAAVEREGRKAMR